MHVEAYPRERKSLVEVGAWELRGVGAARVENKGEGWSKGNGRREGNGNV